MRSYSQNRWGLFLGARRHTYGCVVSAALLLGVASLALVLAAFQGWGQLAVLGQVLFVVLVFAAITLLLITAIAQDIRFRGDQGMSRRDRENKTPGRSSV